MAFKRNIRSPRFPKGTQYHGNPGKGAVEQHLPSRQALNTLTKGDPSQRTLNDYAKATPAGASDMDADDMPLPSS